MAFRYARFPFGTFFFIQMWKSQIIPWRHFLESFFCWFNGRKRQKKQMSKSVRRDTMETYLEVDS